MMAPNIAKSPEHPCGVRIDGIVSQAAEVRLTSGHYTHALLSLRLRTDAGLQFWVQRDMGAEFVCHLAAQTMARRLPAGAPVRVECGGLRVMSDQTGGLLACSNVTDIRPMAQPPASHSDIDAPLIKHPLPPSTMSMAASTRPAGPPT